MVSAVVVLGNQVYVLQVNREQLLHRDPGDLLTSELVAVIPTQSKGM